MKKRQAQPVARPALRRLRYLLASTCAALPLSLVMAQAQVEIEVKPAAQAQAVQIQIGGGGVVQVKPENNAAAKPADKAEEKPAVVDADLEKEIAKLSKELEGLKKGTTDFDLKEAELKRKQRELQLKTAAAARKKQLEQQQEQFAERVSGGATLDTDSEVDMLLDRARDYAQEGRYRDACVLWQHVLDQKPGLTDRQPTTAALKGGAANTAVLRPVRDLVEMELAALPPEGLNEYRITADADARAALAAAQGDREMEGLSEVVRRFFMSSLGDDAAYRMACIQMDEWDFISARRLLDKIVTSHPDPSISRADLLLRLAVVNAKAGDGTGARKVLAELTELTKKDPLPGDLLAVVQRVVDAGAAMLSAAGPVQGWPMALGAATRDGVMAGLPGKVVEGDSLWLDQPVLEFDFKVPELVGKNQVMGTPQQGAQGRQEIVSRWEKGGWTPTSQVLLKEGKAFFKTHNELRWYDLSNRKLVETIAQPALKLDAGARIWAQNYYYGPQKPETPSSTEEIAMFGDRIAKSMSLIGDTLYHLEGRVFVGGPNARIMVWNNNKQTTLQMTERLCAVDTSEEGKGNRIKWRYPVDADSQTDMRFLAPPVPSGDRLLVPMLRNGELFLTAIDAASGKQLWNTLLCMPPNDDSSRWATVGVAVVGSEAYVATGYGVIMAVDAGAGNILWAARYKRSEPSTQQNQMVMFGGRGKVDLPGWSEDFIIPRGDKLIVLPSDGDQVFCFSRISGKQLWSSPREKATYALGVLEDSLYVAGRNVVRRYGIHSGKLEREQAFKFDSHARGALTPQGIYLPTRGEIVRLDPKTMATVGKLRVATTSRDPIGNLFCDGQNLVAAGLDRVYALSDGDMKMKELSEAIAKSDTGPLRVERAFLYEVIGKRQAAVEDLRIAHKLLPAGKDRDEAARKLVIGLLEIAKTSPENVIALYEEAERVAAPLKQQVRVWLARGRYHAAKNEAIEALDLFLKAAQDTSDALVLVDDEDGRREARASLAAGAEIRELVGKMPALADELSRRGEAALRPHLELAALEKVMTEPGAALPHAQEIQKLESELAIIEKDRKEAEAKVAAVDKERKQIEFQIGVEETTPTGRLEALRKQLADLETKVKPDREAAASLASAHAAKKTQVDGVRGQMGAQLQRLTDLKANRMLHTDRLLALGDLYPGSTVELQAHLLAARYLWNDDWFERAELVLRELAASPNRSIAAAGTVALAKAYETRQWSRQAHMAWTRVQRDFADVEVEQGDKKVKAGELARASLADIKVNGDTTLAIDRRMPEPPYEKAWAHQHNGQYYLDTDDSDPSQFLEDHLMMLNTGNSKIICKNVETGVDLWHLSLQRSNHSGSSTTNGRIVQFNNYNFPNGRLVRQGHIALLSAPDRLMAFGLTSGKQLWETAALMPANQQNRFGYYYGAANPIMPVAVGSGVVVDYGIGKDRDETQVRALDAQTGKVRWIGEFKNDQIVGLNASRGHVFVFVNNGNEVIICDAVTGQRTGRVKFENRQPQFPITWTKHGMLVTNMQKATLYDLPSGKEKWSTPLTNKGQVIFTGYQRIDMVDENRACILNGGVFVLDLTDGKVIVQASAAELGGRYINDAAATPDGKEIIAVGYGNANEQIINIIDTATGKVKSSINLGQRMGQQIQASKVAAAGDLIPVLINDPPKDLGGGRKQYTNNASVAFFRKSDGKRVDVNLPGGDASMRVQNAQSPLIRGNVFMVLTYQNITAYRRVPNAPVETLKEFVAPPVTPEKKDDKKGAGIEVPGVLPQVLPGIVPGRRIIIQGGKIEINGKQIELKKVEQGGKIEIEGVQIEVNKTEKKEDAKKAEEKKVEDKKAQEKKTEEKNEK